MIQTVQCGFIVCEAGTALRVRYAAVATPDEMPQTTRESQISCATGLAFKTSLRLSSTLQLELDPRLPASLLAFQFPKAGQLIVVRAELALEANDLSGDGPPLAFQGDL